MKKTLETIICCIFFFILCFSLAGCTSNNGTISNEKTVFPYIMKVFFSQDEFAEEDEIIVEIGLGTTQSKEEREAYYERVGVDYSPTLRTKRFDIAFLEESAQIQREETDKIIDDSILPNVFSLITIEDFGSEKYPIINDNETPTKERIVLPQELFVEESGYICFRIRFDAATYGNDGFLYRKEKGKIYIYYGKTAYEQFKADTIPGYYTNTEPYAVRAD